MATIKRNSKYFQLVIVLIGIFALYNLIRFPLTEGRAVNLDLLSIYLDPFILYGYAASIVFFVALYNVFKIFGNYGQNELFSSNSIKNLKSIKLCANLLCILIVLAAIYIRLFHAKEDDPAGFLAISMFTTFISIIFATGAAKFEKHLQNCIDQKTMNI